MTATVDVTETLVFTALRAFLLAFLPSVEVVKGQVNRVPEPIGPDFVTMIPIYRERIETNTVSFLDRYLTDPNLTGQRFDFQPVKLTVQLDVHGPNSPENSQIITSLWRSEAATLYFSRNGYSSMAPLYSEEPKQIPFANSEQQIEERWVIDIYMQINPTTTSFQDFADTLTPTVIEVEATYPVS